MFGLIADYDATGGAAPFALRREYRLLLARQPGYRRCLELRADGWRRRADLFLFSSAASAQAALDSPAQRAFMAARPGGHVVAPALLVGETDATGAVVVLRRLPARSPGAGQRYRKERLAPVMPATEMW